MAEWRITDEQPVRELETLDHERCAALHNQIVELGWTQRGLALDKLDKRTWWQCYGGDAALASISARLDCSVISFLQAAWHGFAMDSSELRHGFHRYLVGLASPEQLWQNVNYAEDEDDSNKQRYLTLYMANWALGASHPLGLVLNQEDGTAMQHMSIHDTDVTMNGRQTWLPLEIILDGLIDMIEQGKVVAVDEDYDGEQERTEPWIMPPYTEQDVQDTLQAFRSLVDAVSTRMPTQIQHTENSIIDLVTGGDLDCLPSDSFAYRFLSQAKAPPFIYIAPGLRIADHQPFAAVPLEEESAELFPLLLFRSTRSAYRETRRAPWGEDIFDSPFPHEFHSITTYPAGLYLTETEPQETHPFEDGCRLVLPFTLGNNACARTSDGALIGEKLHSHGDIDVASIKPKSTELYQLGYNHFIEAHDVQLKHVLWKWVDMVEEGKWKVDAQGVVGGMEKWKEADTEDVWQDYQLLMSW
ncbi:unnamed protein product [Aureobasidium mustum]|uniref:Uncharacterized protein n=1 Tax=Aureobasidium mustum TaxID=2773714 RepID=A0A9N8PH47_9PEZI|nr:unnamed protein product [Aureobasidium mustum]